MTARITETMLGSFVSPDEGEVIRIFDEEFRVKVVGDATAGTYALVAGTVAPGGGPPLHSHPGPETFVVLSGEFEFTQVGEHGARAVRGGAGSVYHAPGRAPHRFENVSASRSAMLVVAAPESVDFLRELGAAFPPGAEPNLEKMLAIHERYAVETFYGEAASRPEPAKDGATSARARALAWQLERANETLIARLEACDDEQWAAVCDDLGWSVGVAAHHLAVSQPAFAELVCAIAEGRPNPPLTPGQLDAINDQHAREFAGVARDETLALLRGNGPAAAAIYRQLTDEQLALSAVVVAGAPPLSVLQLIEHAVDHYAEHGGPIEAALAR